MLIYVCKFVMHCITLYCLSYVYIYILCILIVLLGYWNLINLLTYIIDKHVKLDKSNKDKSCNRTLSFNHDAEKVPVYGINVFPYINFLS